MLIRKATETDIPVLNKLLYQVLDVHHTGRPDIFKGDVKKYTDEELCALLKEPTTPVFVAEEDGQVCGYAFCQLQEIKGHNILQDVKTLYIDDLCVDEACRGKRVGSALFDYVKSYAKEQGCYNLTLNVWSCNASAMRFYEKLGMKPLKVVMEDII